VAVCNHPPHNLLELKAVFARATCGRCQCTTGVVGYPLHRTDHRYRAPATLHDNPFASIKDAVEHIGETPLDLGYRHMMYTHLPSPCPYVIMTVAPIRP